MKDQTLPDNLWKRRFEQLEARLQELHEIAKWHPDREMPGEFPSAAEEFFISNDFQVVDNERYAKKHWGEGTYIKVVRA